MTAPLLYKGAHRPVPEPVFRRLARRLARWKDAALETARIPPGDFPARPTYYPRPDGRVVVGPRNEIYLEPAPLPRRKPMVNRAPWQTAQMPAVCW